MARHSHWASIKHKKGVTDQRRGKLFSKLARYITSAARQAGGDPEMNLHLKYAMDKARAANMPKENIDRAVKKGTGELPGESLFEITYEGYGPGGVAILADALTDNRNRTAGEVRTIFETHAGNLGDCGCVGWMFQTKGLVCIKKTAAVTEDLLMEALLDAGVDDIREETENFEIYCQRQDIETVKAAADKSGFAVIAIEITKLPNTMLRLDEAPARKVLALLEELEDNEDVQNVYANLELDESMVLE